MIMTNGLGAFFGSYAAGAVVDALGWPESWYILSLIHIWKRIRCSGSSMTYPSNYGTKRTRNSIAKYGKTGPSTVSYTHLGGAVTITLK